MPATEFALPVQYIRQIAEQVTRLGARLPDSFVQQQWHDIPAGDSEMVLPLNVFAQLVQDAIEATGEPALGLLVGERMLLSSHGILGFAAMNSGTLGQAIGLMEQFFQLRTRLVTVRHEAAGSEVRVLVEESMPLGPVQRPVLEAIVLTLKNLFDFISGGAAQAGCISFPFAEPPYGALARQLFKCEVSYGQPWCGFTTPRSAVDAPLVMADPTTLQQAISVCQQELERMAPPQSWRGKLQQALLAQQGNLPTLEALAESFHMTPRTLHRRLTDEGTSYREIADEVRHTLAIGHLKAGVLSIQEIAYQLGYNDASNFRRAFLRWESVSPSEYQKQ